MANRKPSGRKQKRGRKPRGGKIIDAPSQASQQDQSASPVILHLNCRSSDLESNSSGVTTSPLPYQNDINCEKVNETAVQSEIFDTRTIGQKLDRAAEALENDELSDKSSACFWCTCDFEGAPVHIPTNKDECGVRGYGCFCCPQCAVAHLFSDKSLDKSTIYQRYSLINNVYSTSDNEEIPIRAAPNPHFLLDKFLGTLTINEFRKLSRSDKVVLVVKYPITRSLPQLHVHSSALSESASEQNKYRLSRSERPRSKTQRMNQAFGL